MEDFLNRVAYLESTGAVSAKRRPLICEHVAKVLRDARELGLTRPGEPAAGLPDMFALRSVDIPPVMKLDGPGRALPRRCYGSCMRTCPPWRPAPAPDMPARRSNC